MAELSAKTQKVIVDIDPLVAVATKENEIKMREMEYEVEHRDDIDTDTLSTVRGKTGDKIPS